MLGLISVQYYAVCFVSIVQTTAPWGEMGERSDLGNISREDVSEQ
jgi:hypothetical protein